MNKEEIWSLTSKEFNNKLKIENTPLYWFYKPMLILNVLPKPFLNYEEIKAEKERNKIELVKVNIVKNIIKRYIYRNEKSKIKLRKSPLVLNNKEKILCLTYSNHVTSNQQEIARLHRVIKKIEEDKKIDPFILVGDLLSRKVSEELQSYDHTLYEYSSKEILIQAQSLASLLHQEYQPPNIRLKPELDFLFSKEIIEITINYYLSFKRLLELERIKAVVITGNTGLLDRTLIAAAENLKIPIILVHHGNPGTIPIEIKGKLCVKGSEYAHNALESGFPTEDLVLTGDVNLDQLLEYQKPIEKELIVLATSPIVDDNFLEKEEYLSKIKRYLAEIREVSKKKIVIKLHPRETILHSYKEIVKEFENIEVTQEAGNHFLYSLLNRAKLVIFFGSAIATEAIALNAKVLYIDLFGENNPYIGLYKDDPSVPEVNPDEPIREKIKEILDQKEIIGKEEFIQKYCYKIDGKSTQRVVEVIYDTIEEWKKKY